MDDDGGMEALFSSFLNEVNTAKTTKMKKIEEKQGTPEEIVERLTNMKYDPKQGEGSAYLVLQVSPEATESEITKAYRKMSILIHPDKCKLEKASEAFQLLAKAYADTKDPNYCDKYKDIVSEAKAKVKETRKAENKVRAKKGEDPQDLEGHDFDQEVLRECERMTSKTTEAKAEGNATYEANMKRWAQMGVEAKKARKAEELEKRNFDRCRDKRVAGWQVFMNNVDSKKFKTETISGVGRVGAGDHFHRQEKRDAAHSRGDLKAEVDIDDDKVKRSDTQAGAVGVDRSYMKAWR